MQPAPIPHNEQERLESLHSYQILDSLPEDVYNDIARIASEICGTPMAMLSLIDQNRQWVKARTGISLEESPREVAFCSHVVVHPEKPLIVEDARYDERFHDNPFTTGETPIIFYAGVPVLDPNGHALGSLCVLDSRPREMTEQKLEALKALAKWVQTHFELRKASLALEQIKKSANDLLHSNPKPEQVAQLNEILNAAQGNK